MTDIHYFMTKFINETKSRMVSRGMLHMYNKNIAVLPNLCRKSG
jgi:hypothetical protein